MGTPYAFPIPMLPVVAPPAKASQSPQLDVIYFVISSTPPEASSTRCHFFCDFQH
jgi:hypothetical protein